MREKILSIVEKFNEREIRVYITTQPHLLKDLTAKPPLDRVVIRKIRASERDIEDYVRKNLPTKEINEDLRTEIATKISSESDGM